MITDADASLEPLLLDAWEQGYHGSASRRGELLLGPLGLLDGWPDITVGERNRRLLMAHRILFGPTLECVIVSPCCGERIELRTTIDTEVDPPPPAIEVVAGSRTVRCRLPTCADLAAVAEMGDPEAVTALIDRCLADGDDGSDGGGDGDDGSRAALADDIEEAVAAADPFAIIDVRTTCPACGESVVLPLDPASFAWQRLGAWAARLLEDIHHLARGYGWTEGDILALTPPRRRSYLQLLGAP